MSTDNELAYIKHSIERIQEQMAHEIYYPSRRDYFAAAALTGLLASNFENDHQAILSLENMAKNAVDQAEIIIKELNRK